ncbi:metallophosphoesterase family protein, partial [Leptothrix ochracea]
MRILACSDIHGNVEAVRKIRDLEANIFDVIVIAGDIGNGNTGDVLSCFGSFGCPVLYVYGNWDNKVSYDVSFSPGFNHIHNNLICIDGYYFGGYSGCSASWGMNPIYLDLLRDVNERHKETIRIRNELRFDFDRQESAIHADFLERMRLLKEQRHK